LRVTVDLESAVLQLENVKSSDCIVDYYFDKEVIIIFFKVEVEHVDLAQHCNYVRVLAEFDKVFQQNVLFNDHDHVFDHFLIILLLDLLDVRIEHLLDNVAVPGIRLVLFHYEVPERQDIGLEPVISSALQLDINELETQLVNVGHTFILIIHKQQ
jgi:hypothetical protein